MSSAIECSDCGNEMDLKCPHCLASESREQCNTIRDLSTTVARLEQELAHERRHVKSLQDMMENDEVLRWKLKTLKAKNTTDAGAGGAG